MTLPLNSPGDSTMQWGAGEAPFGEHDFESFNPFSSPRFVDNLTSQQGW